MVKNLSARQETWVWSLGQEDPLEKRMATHSSILAWRIPWTEEPGGVLQSMGSQRVGHDWATNTFTYTHTYKHIFFFRFFSLAAAAAAKSLQSCPTLCDPRDGSLPGSAIHGIFQARVLEWVAISFSRGIFLTQGSNPGFLHCRQILYHLSHQRSP